MPNGRRKLGIGAVRGGIGEAMRSSGAGPALRRYMVNTIFDATFVILGVVIGLAFAPEPDFKLLIGTMLTSSVALAISTGVSVYEGESMEQRRKVEKLEEAMLVNLDDTEVERASGISKMAIASANFATPLLVCGIVITPFIILGEGNIRTAGSVAVLLALSMLFLTGAMLGRSDKHFAWLRGLRMGLIGLAAFAICYTIESLI